MELALTGIRHSKPAASDGGKMKGERTPRRRIMIPGLEVLEQKVGIKFSNRGLLVTALTHRSYLNEHRDEAAEHNERLEFLGDAILEAVVTHHLYKAFQDPEGRLTNLRASLVCGEALFPVGVKLELGKYIRMSTGERVSFDQGERSGKYIIANAVEALIGAIFLDRGFGVAELFIHHFMIPKLKQLQSKELRDPKSLLQETAQERVNRTPTYRVLSQSGPDHQKVFVVGVYLEGRQVGTGTGASKKEAQTQAAIAGLQNEFKIKAEDTV